MIAKIVDFAERRFNVSIRSKLAIAFSFLIAIVSTFIFLYLPMKLEERSFKSIAERAQSIAEMTSFSVGTALLFDDVKTIDEAIAGARQNEDLLYIIVLDTAGRTVTSFNNPAAVRSNYLSSEGDDHISDDGTAYRLFTPILSNGHEIGKLYVGLSLTELKNEISRTRTAVATISLLIFIIGMAAAIGLSMVITKHLNQMAETALQVAGGDLTQRVEVSTRDEVGDLANSFNRMIENVQNRTLQLQNEIDQRKKAEDVIREQAALLDVTKDAIIVSDLDDRILFWNKGAEQLYGWNKDEAIDKDIVSLFQDGENRSLRDAKRRFAEHGEWQGEMSRARKNGDEIIVESRWTFVCDPNGKPRSILITDTDVTEKKKLEAQFLRSQRMQSVGTLAGGIAHDLNNVLGPILLSVHMLKSQPLDEPSQGVVTLIESSVLRAKAIIGQILSFARGVEGERATIQLKHLVKEFETMIKDTFPRSISIKSKSVRNPWPVCGDLTQLYQVLMNLSVNARDAMPSGGALEIEIENTEVDEYYAKMHIDAKPGKYTVVTVTDTGTGMSRDIIDKIFDPFFTTKEIGKGTGLGLSTTLGIVRSHGGFVNVYSEVGKGSRFKVYLPASELDHSEQQVKSETKLPRGEGEMILVVDDEEPIRQTQKMILEAHGYNVMTANDGTEAITIVARGAPGINVVITDMMMPMLDGASTIRALRKLNPELKFIGVSGLMDGSKTAGFEDDTSISFLQKPFTAQALLSTLDNVIGN